MVDKYGNLFKNEESDRTIKPAAASKKLGESKRRLNGICRSLMIDSSVYEPKRTVGSVETYLATTEKVDRMLYSVISGFIIGLDEKARGTFSTNVDKLLQYVLDEENQVSEDSRKICIKLYDHFQLNLTQIESANIITKKAIANAMKDEIEESHKEIKGIQKEYITILGIFAAIMLAFVGSFTFSTSVLNNLGSVDVFELVIVAIIIGLVFVILITLLLDFLREINDKIITDESGRKQWSKKTKTAIGILVVLSMVTLISYGISKMSFPENINIGGHQYQLIDENESPAESEEVTESEGAEE